MKPKAVTTLQALFNGAEIETEIGTLRLFQSGETIPTLTGDYETEHPWIGLKRSMLNGNLEHEKDIYMGTDDFLSLNYAIELFNKLSGDQMINLVAKNSLKAIKGD